jgi:hypothetical protein
MRSHFSRPKAAIDDVKDVTPLVNLMRLKLKLTVALDCICALPTTEKTPVALIVTTALDSANISLIRLTLLITADADDAGDAELARIRS